MLLLFSSFLISSDRLCERVFMCVVCRKECRHILPCSINFHPCYEMIYTCICLNQTKRDQPLRGNIM